MMSSGSTVPSKAFDKVNHYVLFNKLMKRQVPRKIIYLLRCWYENTFLYVRWYNEISRTFQVFAGVRQGGILSPILFLIYVDDLLLKLNKFGCKLFGFNVGALMFADDIALLAPSVREIQSMLDACESELKLLDLKVSASKSMCIRIGNRYKAHCCQLLSSCGIVPWVNEARYLGMHIASNHKFIVDLSKAKAKFYRSANAILGKLGNQKNPAVSL